MEFIRFDISFWLSIYIEVNLIIDVCQGELPETSSLFSKNVCLCLYPMFPSMEQIKVYILEASSVICTDLLSNTKLNISNS